MIFFDSSKLIPLQPRNSVVSTSDNRGCNRFISPRAVTEKSLKSLKQFFLLKNIWLLSLAAFFKARYADHLPVFYPQPWLHRLFMAHITFYARVYLSLFRQFYLWKFYLEKLLILCFLDFLLWTYFRTASERLPFMYLCHISFSFSVSAGGVQSIDILIAFPEGLFKNV